MLFRGGLLIAIAALLVIINSVVVISLNMCGLCCLVLCLCLISLVFSVALVDLVSMVLFVVLGGVSSGFAWVVLLLLVYVLNAWVGFCARLLRFVVSLTLRLGWVH